MIEIGLEIGRATEYDLEGILELQAANQPAKEGGLSANLPRSRVVEMINGMPVIVARRNDRIIGFLMTSERATNTDIPIMQAMLAAYPGTDTSYIYGPVCVDAEERGNGLAQAMFAELSRLEPRREGILFIRRDNKRSLRAHEKMGMREVGEFVFKGVDHAVLCYFG